MTVRFTRMRFTACELEQDFASLRYRLEGPDGPLELCERFALPPHAAERRSHPATRAALEGLHLAAGVSYWKAACPPELSVETSPLDALDAEYFTALYRNGLGEFFFRNELDPRHSARFPAQAGSAPALHAAPPCDAPPWVLVGGGKDSAVSTEIARRAGLEVELLSFGRPPAIARAAAAAELPYRALARHVDPALGELNARGALNGHVPISAVLAHASLLAALLAGRRAVVASNERSASEGNVLWRGLEVNHQWSKGLAFERALRGWFSRRVAGGPEYLSLLRPLSELHIAERFSRYGRYFDAVTSCNQNFRLDERGAPQRWCGTCPKCVFVYLVLRPFLEDGARDRLFGRSFLGEENLAMAAALAGRGEQKPFECVGTAREVCAALHLGVERGREPESPVYRWFRAEVRASLGDPEALVREAFTPSEEHCLSPSWREVLDAELRAP